MYFPGHCCRHTYHYVFLLCKENSEGKLDEGEPWLMSCNWRGQSSWIIGQRSTCWCDFPRHMKNMHIVQFTFILMCFSRYASYQCKIMHNRIALAYCNYSYNYSHTPNQSYAHAQRMSATMSFSPLQKNAFNCFANISDFQAQAHTSAKLCMCTFATNACRHTCDFLTTPHGTAKEPKSLRAYLKFRFWTLNFCQFWRRLKNGMIIKGRRLS